MMWKVDYSITKNDYVMQVDEFSNDSKSIVTKKC